MIISVAGSSFNGQRLKIARLYRNLSVSDLADKIGIKKQSISQFEIGVTKPKVETELLLIRELGFPRNFFYQNSDTPEVNKTFFRALSSASALDKKTQETIKNITSFFTSFFIIIHILSYIIIFIF